jgi:purine-cytosine permease-like protein
MPTHQSYLGVIFFIILYFIILIFGIGLTLIISLCVLLFMLLPLYLYFRLGNKNRFYQKQSS